MGRQSRYDPGRIDLQGGSANKIDLPKPDFDYPLPPEIENQAVAEAETPGSNRFMSPGALIAAAAALFLVVTAANLWVW